ncbi:MAG: gliding motility-associated C-terminal domain-containing protein [Sporocytophaga sp.]|uniref:PKD domain-containing protein n=1 Tax=Sporocytophaga sp. TaxID=2231183 RepID=UPI001B2E45CF|nr:PKD domain-containing protein [Sporocytophaga sp.]MBO9699489.1 gliding motility-associated C-terminal domain-containing protein [Sporocytophaga sp.]
MNFDLLNSSDGVMKPNLKTFLYSLTLIISVLCLSARSASAQSSTNWWWWLLNSNDCVSYRKTPDTSVCVPARITVSLVDIKFKKGTSNYSVFWSLTPFTSTPTSTSMGTNYLVSVSQPTTVYFLITNNNCTEKGSIQIYATTAAANGKATITDLKSSYCISGLKSRIYGTPAGGIFTGPGVVSGGKDIWYFDPAISGPGKHVIKYSAGCIVPAQQTVTIDPAPCSSVLVGAGSGSVGLIAQPQGITTTCIGKIYFSDSNNNKIWVIDENGASAIINTAGTKGNTVGTDPTTVKLNLPTGLVSFGNTVYFCDQVNHNIKAYNPSTGVQIIAGENAATPVGGDLDGIGTAARFRNPYGIAIDDLGKTLYVSDSRNFKIKKIDIATKQVTTVAGSTTGDVPDGASVPGPVAATAAQFGLLGHLTFAEGNLYIADPSRSVIKKLNLATNMVSVAVNRKGSDERISGLAIDCDGNVYYSDVNSNNIFKVSTSGSIANLGVSGLDAPSSISIYNRGYLDVANFGGNSVTRSAIKGWKESAFTGLKNFYCNTETTSSTVSSTICTKNLGAGSYSQPAEYISGKWQFSPAGKTPGVYAVKYYFTSGISCTDSLSKDVYVFTTPELEPLEVLTDAFCGNYGIVAKIKDAVASPMDTIIWKNDKGVVIKVAAGSIDTLDIRTVAKASTYSAFAKNPACSYTSESVPATYKGIRFKMPSDTTICKGNSITLKPTLISIQTGGTIEQFWSPAQLFSEDRDKLFMTQPDSVPSTTVFKLQMSVNGCTGIDSVKVSIKPKPSPLSSSPLVIRMCPLVEKLIGFENAPTDGITYTWKFDPSYGAKKIDITENLPLVSKTLFDDVIVTPPTLFVRNTYNLISTNEYGCSSSDIVNILIFPKPKINLGNDTTICKGSSVMLGKENDPKYQYEWNKDPSLVGDQTAFPIATPVATTNYVLKVIETLGECINYDTIKVSLKSLPPKTAMDRVVGMCDGDPAILGPQNPSSNYKYEWSPAAGLDNYLSPNPKATPSVSGTVYTLTMKDASGTPVCSDTAKVTVKISSKPTNVVAKTLPDNSTGICPGNAIGLEVASTPGYKVAWWPAETLNDSTLWIATAKPSVTTRYKVKVTTGDGCSDTSSVEVIVDKISVDAGTDIIFCPGDSGKFNGTYQSVSALTSQKWSEDIDGISNATGVSDIQDFHAFVKIAEGTSKKYYLKVTNSNSCSVVDSIIVTASTKPTADAGEDTGDCIGNTFMLGGVGNPSLPSTYSFSWTPGNYTDARPSVTPTTDGINTFILKVKDNVTNCTAADTVELTIRPKPVKDEIVSNTPQACDGTDVTLSVNPNSSLVTWMDDENTLLDQGATHSVNTDGTYYAIFEQNGCYDTSKYTIDFMAPPVISSIESPMKSCMADGIPLKVVTSQGDGVLVYEWTVASSTGVFSTPEKDSTFFKSDNSSLASGVKTFTVKVSNQCGNVTLDKDVTFVPSPEASFRADGPSKSLDNTSKETMDAISGDIISFVNTVDTVAQNISTWKWDFKDGNTSNLFNSSYTYSNPGKYNVELTVVNKDGCSSVASLGVEVLSSKYLFVPNIFNPYSRNPENSVCKVYGLNISSQSFTFKVFNKWGEVVFETSDFNMANRKGWDGQNAPMGVYTYMVVGKFNDGSEFEKSGTVTLVR